MGKNNYQNWTKKELLKEIKHLKKRKKYGLVWEERPEAVVELCKNKLPVVKEVKNKAIIADKNKPINLLIEGDNYHALSVLNYTHAKKIDVIYIDPPYNTGAKDWKYNNKYVDINDAYRHSKWLNMMFYRLRIAKNLLKNDGVFICAIDDNERDRLGLLLEDLFSNREIHCVTIIHNPRGVQGKNFSYTHEYAYFVLPKGTQIIQDKKRKTYSNANLNLRDKGSESLRTDARNCFYPFYIKGNKIIGAGDVPSDDFHPSARTIHKKNGVHEVWPIDVGGVERKWRYARQSVEEVIDILKAKKTNTGYEIEIYKEYEKYKTVWNDPKYNGSLYGTKILHELLPGCDFDFPKSIYLTRECLYSVIAKNKNAIVLDFFAGSGTTSHSLMMLNKEDDGSRQFILCTNNENNIATEVCYPRIKKVIMGHKKHPDTTGIPANLKYFKTDFVDAEPTDKNKKKLTEQATEMLCIREGTFESVLDRKYFKIFKNIPKRKSEYKSLSFDSTAR